MCELVTVLCRCITTIFEVLYEAMEQGEWHYPSSMHLFIKGSVHFDANVKAYAFVVIFCPMFSMYLMPNNGLIFQNPFPAENLIRYKTKQAANVIIL